MTRGITEEEVHQAADAIVGRGERPTIERIRAELGRGSPNTVNRHLDGWWATLPKRLTPQTGDLPSEIVELARKIWQQVLPKAAEQAESRLKSVAEQIESRRQEIERTETDFQRQRAEFAESRVALDRRIGELEALLAARDAAQQEAARASKLTSVALKTAEADAAAAKAALAKAQAAHSAEASKLAERLAGTEKRLMERLVQEKTARDVDGAAARKRIKVLEEDLRAARKLLTEHSAAALPVQEGLRLELEGLRKLLSPRAQARRARSKGTVQAQAQAGRRGRKR